MDGPGQCGRVRPKSIILKGESCNFLPMLIRVRHILTIVAISLAGSALSGCGTINEKLSAGMGDYVPPLYDTSRWPAASRYPAKQGNR